MRPVGTTLTYLGVGLVTVGFGVLAFAWAEVAGLAHVALQMPYLISGGLVGVGLILTGLTLVVVDVKRQDVAARERQLAQLAGALAEIRALVQGEELPDADGDGDGDDDGEQDPSRTHVGAGEPV